MCLIPEPTVAAALRFICLRVAKECPTGRDWLRCRQVPICAVAADNRCVDSREQAFAEVAARQLNFLTVSSRGFAGFTGPQIDQHGAGPGSTVLVSYRKGPLTIGIRLVRGHGGDDYVMIAGMVDGGEDDAAHQRELKRDKVRTDRQMVRAVTKNAKLIRATMS